MKKRGASEPYVKHHRSLIESPAWRCLSRSAKLLLERIELEHLRHGGKKNGKLIVTYDDFREFGVGDFRATAKALREAETVLLLEIVRGSGGNGEFRTPNLMRLTYVDGAGEERATNEWREIKTLDEAKARLDAVQGARRRNTWQQIAEIKRGSKPAAPPRLAGKPSMGSPA
jgi:hypothetical protein